MSPQAKAALLGGSYCALLKTSAPLLYGYQNGDYVVYDALSIALFRLRFPEQVIVHSDRDNQYRSKDYL